MEKIKGIITPLVTPLLDNEHLDVEGAGRLADHVIDGGVSAIFLLGTTGESQSIAMHLRYEFVELMCRHIAGRVPVLVAITETSMEDSLALARHAKECGVQAVVSAPPYYFPANQRELVDWYTELAGKCPLPIYLYNMPSKVKVFFDVSTVVELSRHPNIIGIKDSSGNIPYIKELISIFKDTDFAVYMGPEELTSEVVMLGCDGGVNGGANLFPELFVQSYKAAASGDAAKAGEYQERIMYLSDNLYRLNPESDASFLCGVKCALGLSGLCSDYLALPYRAYDGERKARAAEVLEDLKSKNYR